MTPLEKAATVLRRLFRPQVTMTWTTTRVASRPLTAAEEAAFDRAFVKMDEAFQDFATILNDSPTKDSR